MPFKFSKKSLDALSTCDIKLQKIFREVINHRDCTVLEGFRNQEKQDKAFKEGKSKVKWPNGKHNKTPSQAVDVVPYPINWDDKQGFTEFGNFVMGVACGMGINIDWGGKWKTFQDSPHYELS